MFISYDDYIGYLIIKDTEFTIQISEHSNTKMYFDAFAKYYQSINQLTINNVMRFLFFYKEDFHENSPMQSVHKHLLQKCDYYPQFADQVEKYFMWL